MRRAKLPEQEWAKCGVFLLDDSSPVFCGVCMESFDGPLSKARHLQAAHNARLTPRTRPDGIVEYQWRRP